MPVEDPEPQVGPVARLRGRHPDDFLEVFDESDDVAHAKDSRGETLGTKLFEPIDGFARSQELDRDTCYGFDGEGGAAARVSVKLRQNHAADRDSFGEGFRHVHGVSAHQGVANEELVGRFDSSLDFFELAHQLVVDGEASGRIINDGAEALALCAGEGIGADGRR